MTFEELQKEIDNYTGTQIKSVKTEIEIDLTKRTRNMEDIVKAAWPTYKLDTKISMLNNAISILAEMATEYEVGEMLQGAIYAIGSTLLQPLALQIILEKLKEVNTPTPTTEELNKLFNME